MDFLQELAINNQQLLTESDGWILDKYGCLNRILDNDQRVAWIVDRPNYCDRGSPWRKRLSQLAATA